MAISLPNANLQTFQREMQEAFDYIALPFGVTSRTHRRRKIERGFYGGGNMCRALCHRQDHGEKSIKYPSSIGPGTKSSLISLSDAA